MLDRVPKTGRPARRQPVADLFEVSAGDEQQTIGSELRFAHFFQPRGASRRVTDVALAQDAFKGRDVICRRAAPGKHENDRSIVRCWRARDGGGGVGRMARCAHG